MRALAVRTTAIGALAVGLLSCAETPPPDPRAAFASASAALRTVETVRYRFRFVPEDDPYYEKRLDGTAVIHRLDLSGSHFRARARATVTPPSGEPYEVELIRHGETVACSPPSARSRLSLRPAHCGSVSGVYPHGSSNQWQGECA